MKQNFFHGNYNEAPLTNNANTLYCLFVCYFVEA